MNRRRTFFWVSGLCLWVSLVGMAARPPLVGGPAPDFTLKDLEGRSVSLADHRGKVVLLNFWATWCEPCKKEMPEMQAAYEKLKDRGFVILAVNFGEDPDPAAAFGHHGRLTFPILLDPRVQVAARYEVVTLPVSFYIDSEGMVRERVFGGTLTEAGIAAAFERLGGGPPPGPSPPRTDSGKTE